MCGIFGIAGPNYEDAGRKIQALSQRKRGPDGFGEFVDPSRPIYLAHNRLAIVDLSEHGAQPMCNEDRSVWITYNGEIYGFDRLRAELQAKGHTFVSHSDTEVIVHAYEEWGPNCVHHLNGMFAFAIWDRKKSQIFLARDRSGVKPLFYGLFGQTLAFASDSRALSGLGFVQRRIHGGALATFLLHNYVSGAQSIWQDIKKLPPAHHATYNLETGSLTIERYWQLQAEEKEWNAEEASEAFSRIFQSSVGQSLVSDVDVGVFLSGGYDSSAVACAATKAVGGANTQTFTIGFDESEVDESAFARETASRIGSVHHERRMSKSHMPAVADVIGAFDEPHADSTIFPLYMLSRYTRERATVALSGDGADEIFGGYSWYRYMEQVSWKKRMAFGLEPVIRALGFEQTTWGRRCSAIDHYRMLTSAPFSLSEIRSIFPGIPADQLPDQESDLLRQYALPGLQGSKMWQYVDFHTFMVDNNLAMVDRCSMAHSLEVRVPFLDHRLIEFAFSLPAELIAANGKGKIILSDWLKINGLGAVTARKKQGFSSPYSKLWPKAEMVQEINTGWLSRSDMVNQQALRQVTNSGDGAMANQLFVLATLSVWGGQFGLH